MNTTPSQWMVVMDYNSKLHGLRPRVGRFRNSMAAIEDMEFFGGPDNYYATVSDARETVTVLNSPE